MEKLGLKEWFVVKFASNAGMKLSSGSGNFPSSKLFQMFQQQYRPCDRGKRRKFARMESQESRSIKI